MSSEQRTARSQRDALSCRIVVVRNDAVVISITTRLSRTIVSVVVDQLRSHERHGLQQAGDETKDRARLGHIRRNDRRAREVHVIEPLAHRRAAALELGAKDAFGTAEDLINEAGKGGLPLVIEATNSPSDLGTLCASRIGG